MRATHNRAWTRVVVVGHRSCIDPLRAARDCEMHTTTVNGEPEVVFTRGGAVVHVVSLRIEGGGRAVSMTLSSDKLSRWSVAEIRLTAPIRGDQQGDAT